MADHLISTQVDICILNTVWFGNVVPDGSEQQINSEWVDMVEHKPLQSVLNWCGGGGANYGLHSLNVGNI